MLTTNEKNARKHSPELVLVDFYSQQIEAILWQDDVWVSVKRICENLEIDHATQNKKIKGNPSFKGFDRDIPIETSKGARETFCIKLEAVTLWLASIQPNRIPDLAKRDRLIKYQVECMQVLTKHFFEEKAAPQPEPPAQPITSARMLLQQAQLLVEHEDRLHALEERIRAQEHRAQMEQQERENALGSFPAPQSIPPGRTMRSHLVERMRLVAIQTKSPFQDIWNRLYREFRDRTQVDLKTRAKNRKMKYLDMAEELHCISNLYDLCCSLWPLNLQPEAPQLPPAPPTPLSLPSSEEGENPQNHAIVQIPSWALNKLLICQAKGGMKKEMADILWNASAMKIEGEELVDWPPSHQMIAGGISVKDYGMCYILEYGGEEYLLRIFESNPE